MTETEETTVLAVAALALEHGSLLALEELERRMSVVVLAAQQLLLPLSLLLLESGQVALGEHLARTAHHMIVQTFNLRKTK